jgi:hypothetical protein
MQLMMVIGRFSPTQLLNMLPPRELGVLSLGLFVGVILGYGLMKSGGTLRAGITVLGAALGGGPILFMKSIADERWAYPIGLLLGLGFARIGGARTVLAKPAKSGTTHFFAWLDIIVIAVVTLVATVYSAIPQK